MRNANVVTATCLCGSVGIKVLAKSGEIGVCHCDTCRKWSGSPYLAIESDSAVFTGDSVNTYSSSEWAERGFCNQCGTHLFYKLKNTETHYVPAGLLSDAQELVMTHQIFIDRKPDYYDFAQQTSCMTGKEFMAMMEGTQE